MGDVTIPAGALALFIPLLGSLATVITYLFRRMEQSHRDERDERLAVTDERIKIIREVHAETLRISEERRQDEAREKEVLRNMLRRAIDNLGLATDVAGSLAKEALGGEEEGARNVRRLPPA